MNIPGFRKGKAPYRIIANYVGEAAIIEDAIEVLGNEVYSGALTEAKVQPYASGELEDFTLDPPTFVFTVPMQPTVDMGDYRDVRVEYEEPTVEDHEVDEAMKQLQEENALVEESRSSVEMGNRITVDLHGFFVDNEADEADEADDDDHDHDDTDEPHDHHDHDEEEVALHDHDVKIVVDHERAPLPGFADEMVGAEVGEEREFVLAYPDDVDRYGEHLAGREVRFYVTVNQIEVITLPSLNDEFAARVGAELYPPESTSEEDDAPEPEPMSLLELRMRIRKDMQEEKERYSLGMYVDKVVDEMREGATFAYPEAMIRTQVESMVEQVARRVNVPVEDYLRLSNQAMDDIYDDQKEVASTSIERSLVYRGVIDAEGITITDEQIDEEINKSLERFGDQADMYRSIFDTPAMRDNIANNVLEQAVMDRIAAIGKGEAPEPVEVTEAEAAEEPEEQSTE